MILGYIPVGTSMDNGYTVDKTAYDLYSYSEVSGAANANYDPDANASASIEREAPPDVGVAISIYDPELQALLAYE